jgi:signal transduction histidine kinase
MAKIHDWMRFKQKGKERLDGAGPCALIRFCLAVARATCGLWLCVSAVLSCGASDNTPESGASNITSLAELCSKVSEQGCSIQSFRIEGVVCAVVPARKLLALQDSSACALLELPTLDQTIQAGDWVALTANHCALTRSRFGIQVGTAPVVNNDGHHPALVKAGQVYLETGWQPIRVTWFNGFGPLALRAEYEGPGIQRQRIPPAVLWHKPAAAANQTDFQPGLDFAAYTGDWYYALPDFRKLAPAAQGVATNIDLQYSVRRENSALAFSGFISVSNAGIYTFYLESDDGGLLYAGDPAASCEITAQGRKTVPSTRRYKESLAKEDDHAWTELEGEVTFAAPNEQELDLELTVRGERVQLAVVEGSPLFSRNLLHRHLKAVGIVEALPDPKERQRARLIVPGPNQIETLDPGPESRSEGPITNKVLTSIEQIRRLTPPEAARHFPAKVSGVVIWSSYVALVLQDATAGVYIHYTASNWVGQPRVGESWEIEGRTDPGDFSPVLMGRQGRFMGSAALPEPIRPTRDQLLNGSLDAEFVELRGALTEISTTQMTLLTSEGKIRIHLTDDRPLPYLPAIRPHNRSYVDSIVRIRGCLMASWDTPTRQVRAGEIFLSPGLVQVEQFAPMDLFELPTRRAADLMWFDPSASTLQRTKIKGQIVFARPGEYCLQDESSGLRLRTKEPLQLRPGDLVEAVGFPQPGGPSPILQEAQARIVGKLPLPEPVVLAARDLLNLSHDSTLVRVEATIVSDRFIRKERILELQAGQSHFMARLKPGQPGTGPLAAGSQVQLTGVFISVGGEQANGNLDAFELGLNSAADIRLLQKPPLWTLRRALTIVGVLSGVLAMALVWITLLRRKVEERTTQLQKQIEERQVVEQRRVMEQERTRVAQDLHDELGAGLTEMGLLGDLVKNPAVPAQEKQQYLGQMTDTARSLVASLDEIVWAVNPRYDSVASLASYYTLFAQRFLDLAGVACRPHMPASFPEYPLDPNRRHGLFLAFKEALNNVVRHSGATQVSLKIEVGQGDLIICVVDNGHGFDSNAEAGGGEGLQGMRHRLERLGGGCEIKSGPGSGTEVELRLPVGNHTP